MRAPLWRECYREWDSLSAAKEQCSRMQLKYCFDRVSDYSGYFFAQNIKALLWTYILYRR
jgi:hypothetical protein